MNTKVEEALGAIRDVERREDSIAAHIEKLNAHIAQQDATIARLEQALRLFTGSAYPVEESINPRGYNWSESYLDAALVFAAALKDSP